MLLEIANVLATLHGQGVALGGLHPGMMVLQDTGRVGFSRWSLLEDEEQRDDVRPYLAPEFDKQERSDPTSDVYTLGVILRLIVTGSPTSEVGSDRSCLSNSGAR